MTNDTVFQLHSCILVAADVDGNSAIFCFASATKTVQDHYCWTLINHLTTERHNVKALFLHILTTN